jgi:hypothetical protein
MKKHILNASEMGKESIKVQKEKYGEDVFKKRMEYARKNRWKNKGKNSK